jgi:long-chain fatty acid transport protein
LSRALRSLVALSALALGLAGSRVVHANPLDAFGFGSRGTAMGGAVAADTSDFSANYYNPAGIALARRMELSVGYVNVDQSLYMNGLNSGVDPVRALVAGLVAPGAIANVPFAFGFALHMPDDRLSRVIALPQDQPRWELYDNRNQRLYLAANVAVSPVPWLQIGGGMSFMASTTGSIDISGKLDIFQTDDSQIRHSVTADIGVVNYPQFGARVALGDNAAVALVYRGQFKMDLNLQATLHGNISDLTTAYYDLQTNSVDNFLPQQVVLGGTWEPVPRLHTNLDLTWVNWSAYIPPVADVNVKLNIPPPQGGWPSSITPPTQPAPTAILPIEMHDRIVPHVGVEWSALRTGSTELLVRAGYEYDKSPIGPQTGATNYVDRDRHAMSLGFGVRLRDLMSELPRDLRFDFHGQLSELPTGTTIKSSPTDPVGDYTAGGHIWNVGATLTAGF